MFNFTCNNITPNAMQLIHKQSMSRNSTDWLFAVDYDLAKSIAVVKATIFVADYEAAILVVDCDLAESIAQFKATIMRLKGFGYVFILRLCGNDRTFLTRLSTSARTGSRVAGFRRSVIEVDLIDDGVDRAVVGVDS
jgi:hypothetical protein